MKTGRTLTPAIFSILFSLGLVVPISPATAQQPLDASYVIETFAAGTSPSFLTYDGANVWFTNGGTTLTKMRGADGVILGTFTVGNGGDAITLAGGNIWGKNFLDRTVSKVRATDGTTLGTFDVAAHPAGIAWDGANIWVSSFDRHKVTKL